MPNTPTTSIFKKAGNRRDFLRALGRYPLAVVLAVIGAVLLGRRNDPGSVCTKQAVCRGCGSLDGCPLPQAAAYKKLTLP
jgi:hypothetical protein